MSLRDEDDWDCPPKEAGIPVSLVTDEMVTRAYAAFMQNVLAVTPRMLTGPDRYIHPRDAGESSNLHVAKKGQVIQDVQPGHHRAS